MNRANLPIDGARLWADIMALAEITEPDRPWTRRAFSPRFLQGREWLTQRMQAAGLTVRLDKAGNLIGRRAAGSPGRKVIVLGSHTDTVPEGGRFDGIAGVLAGLEALRASAERNIVFHHDIEIFDCLAEEVSPYGISCVGSRAIAGGLTATDLARRNDQDETLAGGMIRIGADPTALAAAKRDDLAAYLELHIEQGPVLEAQGIDIGIVTAIASIERFAVLVSGRADHAGTTPMGARADALVAAAVLVGEINALASRLAEEGRGHFAATVGEFRIAPNAANVVPSEARLLIDMRAENAALSADFQAALAERAAVLAIAHPGCVATVTPVSANAATPADPLLMQDLAEASAALGASSLRIASGAGHDMAWFAKVCPAAMLFVPSQGGRSHAPEEWTEPDAMALGAAVLLEALIRADRRLAAAPTIDTR